MSARTLISRMASRDFDGCRSCALKENCGHCRALVVASRRPWYRNDKDCRDALSPMLGAEVFSQLPVFMVGGLSPSIIGKNSAAR